MNDYTSSLERYDAAYHSLFSTKQEKGDALRGAANALSDLGRQQEAEVKLNHARNFG